MGVLGGWVFSYERGTPVTPHPTQALAELEGAGMAKCLFWQRLRG